MHGLVRCKFERRYWRARGEDVLFTDVKIKPQIGNEAGGVNDVMHLKRELRFEKKQLVEFLLGKKKVDFQSWARPDDFVRYGRCALVGLSADDVKAVSIVRLCVSLSSCRKTFKLKKVNKSFVPERSRKVFRVYYGFPMSISHIRISGYVTYKEI